MSNGDQNIGGGLWWWVVAGFSNTNCCWWWVVMGGDAGRQKLVISIFKQLLWKKEKRN